MTEKLIAVINDDTPFLQLIKTLLEEEGYNTMIWKEGDSAYTMVKDKQPDLVILDIRLEHPEQGMVVLDLIQLDPATMHIPVIICSADIHFLRQKEAWLTKKGCFILEKPFNLDDLLAIVKKVFGENDPG
jgi:DNA-binding NtrC family response regulator